MSLKLVFQNFLIKFRNEYDQVLNPYPGAIFPQGMVEGAPQGHTGGKENLQGPANSATVLGFRDLSREIREVIKSPDTPGASHSAGGQRNRSWWRGSHQTERSPRDLGAIAEISEYFEWDRLPGAPERIGWRCTKLLFFFHIFFQDGDLIY
jgi:hypothetical protein